MSRVLLFPLPPGGTSGTGVSVTCCDAGVEGVEVVLTGMVRVVGRVVPIGVVVPPGV